MAFDYRAELIRLVKSLLEEHELHEAMALASRLVERFRDPEALALAGRVLRVAGQIDEALGFLSNVFQAWPGDPDVSLELAQLLDMKGDRSTARQVLESAQRVHGDHAGLIGSLGLLCLQEGDMAGGMAQLQRAVTLAPSDADLRIRLAEAFLATGQLPRALANLGRVLDQRPLCLEARLLSARTHWAAGYSDTSRTEAMQALRLPGGRAETLATFAQLQPRSARDPKEVVFVGDWPRTRQAKLAFGLRQAGWRTVLLHRAAPNFDASMCFDEVHAFGCLNQAAPEPDAEEALALARTFHPRAYHVFSQWSEVTSEVMIRNKPGPVIYDVHDTVATIWDEGAKAEEPRQRWCMEHADGLCIRDLRHQFLKRLGYRLPRPKIFFQEYCWRTKDSTEVSNPFPEGEIHLVSAGSFDIEKLGVRDSGLLRLGQMMADQGIHLHIFPSTLQLLALDGRFENIFSDYIDLEARTGLVHMHRPLTVEALAEELRRYTAAFNVTAGLTFRSGMARYDPTSLRYNGGARFFDYLEAELPVVLNRESVFVFRFFERFGLVAEASLEAISDMRQTLAPLMGPEAKARARRARGIYSLEAQIPRLIRFYEQF